MKRYIFMLGRNLVTKTYYSNDAAGLDGRLHADQNIPGLEGSPQMVGCFDTTNLSPYGDQMQRLKARCWLDYAQKRLRSCERMQAATVKEAERFSRMMSFKQPYLDKMKELGIAMPTAPLSDYPEYKGYGGRVLAIRCCDGVIGPIPRNPTNVSTTWGHCGWFVPCLVQEPRAGTWMSF